MEIELTKRAGSAKWNERLRGFLIDALRAEANKSAGVIKTPSWPTVVREINLYSGLSFNSQQLQTKMQCPTAPDGTWDAYENIIKMKFIVEKE